MIRVYRKQMIHKYNNLLQRISVGRVGYIIEKNRDCTLFKQIFHNIIAVRGLTLIA